MADRIGWAFGLVLAAGIWCGAPGAAGGGEVEVLNDRTIWRFHMTYRPTSGRCIKATVPKKRWVRWGEELAAPLPSGDWMKADFRDAYWPRRRGPFLGGYGGGRYVGTALLCVRGRFGVTDPARVKGLKLALTYRGGVVVYVNGSQIARAHMPAGKIEPFTPAEGYPRKVFVTPDGQAMLPDYGRRKPPADVLDRFEARIRKAALDLPPTVLRKGTNVLALELHRTAIPPDLPLPRGRSVNWDTVGLLSAKLSAEAGSAVMCNVGPPDGVQVWNAAPLLRVGHDADYGDPFEPLGPIELMAPVNGLASGQVVVSAPVRRDLGAWPSAEMSDLKSAGGGAIRSGAVRVRYAKPSGEFAALLDDPADEVRALPGRPQLRRRPEEPPATRVRPIWVTAKVPADARGGRYTGELAIKGPGVAARVPVELTVYGWKLREPRQWRTWVNLLQSPESVAGRYGVTLWSDEHFRLMARSMELMGRAGSDLLGISAVARNVFGNDPALVFRRADGRYVPELKFVQRYLKLYDRIAGEPKFLCLHVWSYGMYYPGARRDGKKRGYKGPYPYRAKTIPIIELAGDKLTAGEVPIYGEPGAEETWRPAMDGLRAIVRKLAWREECILLGTAGDTWPSPATVSFFKRIAPYARWRSISHGGGVVRWGPTDADRTQPNGMVVGYCEAVRRITNGRQKLAHAPVACNSRDCVRSDPFHYRSLPGVNTISANFDGFCWKGLDYWTYITPEGRLRSALNTDVHFGNIVGSTPRTIAAPGPGGAVATVQYEMLREGIQDCEAMLLIRDALNDPARRAKLGEDLARRCEAVLENLLCLLETGHRYAPHGGGDVRRHVGRLYAAAADVTAALGGVR